MTKAVTVAAALGCMLSVTTARGHHDASVLGTARIALPVLVGAERLEPGTYEIRLTGEHLKPLPASPKMPVSSSSS